jgi:hypothetical protein
MSNLVQMFAVRMYLPLSYVHLELSDSNRYLGKGYNKESCRYLHEVQCVLQQPCIPC